MERRTRATISIIFLLAIIPTSYMTCLIFLNGPAPASLEAGDTVLPGTEAPIRLVWTGIAAIDSQLVFMLHFFWPVVNGAEPAISLLISQFGGELFGVWSLVMLEGIRAGNRGKVISLYIALFYS